jgi:hypothetical protein
MQSMSADQLTRQCSVEMARILHLPRAMFNAQHHCGVVNQRSLSQAVVLVLCQSANSSLYNITYTAAEKITILQVEIVFISF